MVGFDKNKILAVDLFDKILKKLIENLILNYEFHFNIFTFKADLSSK